MFAKEKGKGAGRGARKATEIKHKKGGDIICPAFGLSERMESEFRN